MPKQQPRRPSSPAALRIEIARHRLQQRDVADRAGLSDAMVSLLLNERRPMNDDQGARIARAIEALKAERQAAEQARREFAAAAAT